MLCLNFFRMDKSQEFDMNKHARNSSKGCVPEVDLEYPKE